MLPSDQTGLFIPLTPRIKYGAGFNPSPRGEREIKKHDFFIKENCLITDETIEQKPGEDSPIGLILCPGKSEEQITLLHLNRGNIRVAAYMTELPSKKLLKRKLHTAIRIARNRLAQKQLISC